MTKQTINIGTSPNKGDGDPLRTAFQKINENFTELYATDTSTKYHLGDDTQFVDIDADTGMIVIQSGFDTGMPVYIKGANCSDGGVGGNVVIEAGGAPLPNTGTTGNIELAAQQTTIESNNNMWTFRDDGVLELPVDGDIVDSNGDSVLGGGGSGAPDFFNTGNSNLTLHPTQIQVGNNLTGYEVGDEGSGIYRIDAAGETYVGTVDRLYSVATTFLVNTVNVGANSFTVFGDAVSAIADSNRINVDGFFSIQYSLPILGTPTYDSGTGRTTIIIDDFDGDTVNELWSDYKLRCVNYHYQPYQLAFSEAFTLNSLDGNLVRLKDINTLTNGAKSISLGSNGVLSLPSNNYIETTDVNLKIGSQGIVTIRSNAQYGETTKSWTFSTDGNLTLPGGGGLTNVADDVRLLANSNKLDTFIRVSTFDEGAENHFIQLVANANGIWRFEENSTLTVPHLFPRTFTATVDDAHFAGDLTLTGDAWSFSVTFNAASNGTIETVIDNTPWPSNPGYADGMAFTFTKADHGIPGYTFTLTLTDIQHPSEFIYTTNFVASQPPTYPATIKNGESIKLTADATSWTFGADGNIHFPDDSIQSTAWTGVAPTATASSTAGSVGYLGMPQNSKNTNYELVIGDMGKHIYVTATSTVTVPAYTSVDFPVGTTIAIVAGPSATVTIEVTTDTIYLAGDGTSANFTLAAYGMATLVKVAQSVWFISGVGLTPVLPDISGSLTVAYSGSYNSGAYGYLRPDLPFDPGFGALASENPSGIIKFILYQPAYDETIIFFRSGTYSGGNGSLVVGPPYRINSIDSHTVTIGGVTATVVKDIPSGGMYAVVSGDPFSLQAQNGQTLALEITVG